MTVKEELDLLLEIIKKYDLPLSPILEYAIKEKEEQYVQSLYSDKLPMTRNLNLECSKELNDYIRDFTSLSVAISKGRKLPHKAILLLCIIRLIAEGKIENNQIPLNHVISDAFVRCWESYYQTKSPSVWTPFYHLKGESFWHFKPVEDSEKLDMMLSFGGTPSIGKMRPVIKYAYFDKALYNLILDKECRAKLEKVLIDNYLSDNA